MPLRLSCILIIKKPYRDIVKFFFLVILLGLPGISKGQDIGLLSFGKKIPQTYINPAGNLEKKWNIALANAGFELMTDGPTYNQLTSINSQGKRYVHPDEWQSNVQLDNLITGNVNIHTIDVGYNSGSWTFLAGHAFRSTGSLTYSEDLLKLVAHGNGPYVNQTLSIGPGVDYLLYNEIYGGIQKKFNKFTIGIKSKLLFGISNLRTESSTINYKTKSDFYQWEFDVDYSIRGSSSIVLNDITDIRLNTPGFSFDHLFYNNTGLAFDLGVQMQLSKNLSIFWSAIDLGFIHWDYLPRNYVSKGKFTFEGVDPISFIKDSTGFNFIDTLTTLIPFTTINESYTTPLTNRFYLGGSYEYKTDWAFFAYARFNRSFLKSNAQLSVSAIRKWKWLHAGLSYSISNGSLFNLGAILQVHWKPLGLFVATDHLIGIFDMFNQKLANMRGGVHISF